MKVICTLVLVALLSGCVEGERDAIVDRGTETVVGVVQDVRVVTTVTHSSPAGGAVVGKALLDAPITGAAIGAGTTTTREIGKLDGCMLLVLVDESLIEFSSNRFTRAFWKEEVLACALRRAGDVISLKRGFTQRESGARNEYIAWEGIGGSIVPQQP